MVFVSERKSYIILRGLLNVHTSSKEKSNESKESFDELKQIADCFPKYHTKILLGDFNVKVGRENNSKPTIWNDSLHQDSKDNVVRIVNFATSKNLVVMSRHVIRKREGRGVYIVLVGKYKGKRLFRRRRRR
jgi:hypothetical protein